MRKLLLRALFFLIPFLYSIYVSAQPKKEKDCGTTCFSSEVVSVEKISSTCTAYELKVSYSGICAHALSHFSVAVPCGQIVDLSNSANWAQEIGKDPTTGLQGFKIDNISNFGETSLQQFTVKFQLCTSGEECATAMQCWQPQVAYKAATCVNYEILKVNCQSLKASLTKKDVSCFGANDGSLSVVIEEGQAPYSYLWSTQTTDASAGNLGAGTYSVVVRDNSGAETTLEETLTEPEMISVSGVTSPASCNGVNNGSINLTVAGGQAPYNIIWDHTTESEDLENLAAGQYTVVVNDQRDCSATARFTVGIESKMNITATHVKPDCNDSNGSIDLSVAGGQAPYAFRWADDEAAGEDRSAIKAGIYKVVVTDNSGCAEEASFFIKENNTLKLEATTTPASCNEDASGGVDLTVTGGTPSYTYEWSNGVVEQDLEDVSSGYYTVKVTDDKGCVATHSYPVSKNTFQVPRTVQQPTCHDASDGSIILHEPIGGTGPYTYVWSTGSETGTALTGLDAGVYSVTVTDATGCSRTLTSTINNPSEIFASATISDASCNSDGSFSIDLIVSGGTAPYTYEWSDGSVSEDRSGLAPGIYTVVITDAHGCKISKEIVVEGGSGGWSCLITEPSDSPICGSSNNALTTSVEDADAYVWSVESTDGSWSITNANASSIVYTAGGQNSSATFTLTITKDGCTQTCSYAMTSCIPDESNEEPGSGEEPEEEEPGNEQPGEEDPEGENPDGEEPGGDGGDQNCDECFDSAVRLVEVQDGCRTFEVRVSTNGLCRHDLSHWNLAVPCGTVSDYWNSGGWKMEFGKDPTTGVYGLKVDGINQFGKTPDSFMVRITICETNECDLSSWNPAVAYKAGQCIGGDAVDIDHQSYVSGTVSVYPNPFEEVVNFEWKAEKPDVTLQIIDQYGNTVSVNTTPTGKKDGYYITLDSADLPRGMYYYRLTLGGKTYFGKISKR